MNKLDYLKKIKRYFPETKFKNSKLIEEGWDHDVIVLDNKYIFRFPKKEKYQERLKSEMKFLKYLAPRISIPIPEYIYISKDLSFGGYKLLKGVEMKPNIFEKLNRKQKNNIIKQLGTFLSELHQTPINSIRKFGFKEMDWNNYWTKPHIKQIIKGLRKKVFPKLTKNEINWVEHQFNEYLKLSFNYKKNIIHSDLTGRHILINSKKGEITGIIDFSDIEVIDPALDFNDLWDYGESFVKQVLTNYKGKIDKDFLLRSKFPFLVRMVTNMLEIEQGANLKTNFKELRKKLNKVMKSGVSL